MGKSDCRKYEGSFSRTERRGMEARTALAGTNPYMRTDWDSWENLYHFQYSDLRLEIMGY